MFQFDELIHKRHPEKPGGEFTLTAKYIDTINEEIMGQGIRALITELTTRAAAEMYPEIVKQLDKELIVKEVALKVSEEILAKMFGPTKGDQI